MDEIMHQLETMVATIMLVFTLGNRIIPLGLLAAAISGFRNHSMEVPLMGWGWLEPCAQNRSFGDGGPVFVDEPHMWLWVKTNGIILG